MLTYSSVDTWEKNSEGQKYLQSPSIAGCVDRQQDASRGVHMPRLRTHALRP